MVLRLEEPLGKAQQAKQADTSTVSYGGVDVVGLLNRANCEHV
jgi:hypothetical protein